MELKSFFHKSAVQLTDLAYSIYTNTLNEEDLFKDAFDFNYKKKGSIGGHGDNATIHFVSKFQNSALRVSYVTLSHKKEFETITEWIRTTFSTGRVKLLDLACGSGAGSVGLLSTLLELRNMGILNNLPLNVEIIGADKSEKSLTYFDKVLSHFSNNIKGTSFNVTYLKKYWDAECSISSNDLMDNFFKDTSDEYFVLLNNFSGAASENEEIKQNLHRIVFSRLSQFSNKKCSFVWLEPDSSKKTKKLLKFIVKLFKSQIPNLFNPKKIEEKKAEYKIYNRIQSVEVPSSVLVHSGRRGKNEF